MKLTGILLLLAILCCIHATAKAEWCQVGTNDSDQKFYVNTKDIRVDRNAVIFWAKTGTGNGYEMTINCQKRLIQERKGIVSRIVPDSVGEAYFDEMCKKPGTVQVFEDMGDCWIEQLIR